MTTTTTTADAGAAAALADLFFHAPEDDKVNGDLRKRYRSWRSSSNGGHATADVLDLNHDAAARASRSKAGMRRVQTVGGKLSTLLPVRAREWQHFQPDSSLMRFYPWTDALLR